MSTLEKSLKRVFDFIGSVFGLIITSPIFLAIIIAQKIEGEGPVFYKQERIGRDGKTFKIVKFRTMKKDCERNGIPRSAEERKAQMTRLGHFLRDHHLDEFPQLWTVFVGDMSLVGYRPERKCFIDQIMEHNPAYEQLYQIRPGLTSMATIYNGYTDTMEKMLKRLDMDIRYLEHRTLMLDLKIILSTIYAMLKGM